MADLSVTVASVAGSPEAAPIKNAGATITAGMAVYLDPSTQTWLKAVANGTATQAGQLGRFGLALHAALSGQPLLVQETGQINVGATLTVGVFYCVSAAVAGNIAPLADLASTNRPTILGYATAAAVLDLSAKRAWPITMP